jgi:hypothetical protein
MFLREEREWSLTVISTTHDGTFLKQNPTGSEHFETRK